MKMTLLEMVSDILNDMDADEVNSIDDTIEAQQVAQIIKTCYFEMMGNRNWPHTKQLFQFQHVGNLARPNYLIAPENLKELITFQYEDQKKTDMKQVLKEVVYREPEAFMRLCNSRDSSKSTVTTVTDYSGVTLLIVNNLAPSYWTSFDDKHIITDSYDKLMDDTLQSSKTHCLGYIIPDWERSDTSVPFLPAEAFPALLEESKSTAFLALKQMTNQKAEQKAGRQQRWLSRKAWTLEGRQRYPDFGRKGRRGY
jgi:hypothetical protein